MKGTMQRFRMVAVGGTFDEFHRGHRTLLMKAFEVSERVMIGLSTDELVRKMHKPHVTAPYELQSPGSRLLGSPSGIPLLSATAAWSPRSWAQLPSDQCTFAHDHEIRPLALGIRL